MNALPRLGFLPILLVLVVVAMAASEPKFIGVNNVLNILRNASFLSIVACGEAVVLIAGGFDLSVGAAVALASVLCAKVMSALALMFPTQPWLAIGLGVAAGLGGGLATGLVNGLCVAVLRISGFVVTLGTMSATLGVALILTNGIPVYGMPPGFVSGFGRAQWLGLPTAVYIAVLVLGLAVFIQRRTLFGRYIYAIGGNVGAATVSGISTRAYLIGAYMVSGLLAAATGILLTAQVGSGQASFGGDRMMLQAIAAAVIGGVSLRGGIGRMEMVALGAAFLTIVTNALNLLRVDSKLQLVCIGVIMVAAVATDEFSAGSGRAEAARA